MLISAAHGSTGPGAIISNHWYVLDGIGALARLQTLETDARGLTTKTSRDYELVMSSVATSDSLRRRYSIAFWSRSGSSPS
jgi:hypothetical protein